MERSEESLRGAIRRLGPAPERRETVADARGRECETEARALAGRLDDRGCAYGRVSNARLEDLARGYERVEAKLNAVLLAVTGTFLSTLAGLAVYHLRGG